MWSVINIWIFLFICETGITCNCDCGLCLFEQAPVAGWCRNDWYRLSPEPAVDQGKWHIRSGLGPHLLCQWGGLWTGRSALSVCHCPTPVHPVKCIDWLNAHSFVCLYTSTFTCMLTFTHTHTHIHVLTHTQTHTDAYTHAHTYTHTHTHTQQMRAHTKTSTHTCMHTHLYAHKHCHIQRSQLWTYNCLKYLALHFCVFWL